MKKANTKKELTVNVLTNCNGHIIANSALYGYRDKWLNTDTNRLNRSKNETTVSLTNVQHENTPIITAYIQHIAPAMSYTAVFQSYCKECNEYLFELLNGVVYAGSMIEKNSIYETDDTIIDILIDDISTDDTKNLMHTLTNNQYDYFTANYLEHHALPDANDDNYDSKIVQWLRKYYSAYITAQKKQLQVSKLHTYHMVETVDGKKHRVECIPYTTIENTAYGSFIADNSNLHYDDNALDIIQVAIESLLELYHANMVNSFSDFWNYRNYVYRKINAYIAKQRKNRNYEKLSIVRYDDAGNEIDTPIETIDKRIERVDKMQVHKIILKHIKKSVHKTANYENIAYTYYKTYIDNDSISDIAKDLRVNSKTVSQYKKTIDRILFNNDEIKDCLYDLLS